MPTANEEKPLAANRAAFHNYHISDKYEAGIALSGTEVKSVMDGRVQLKESYVAVRDGEAWLFNAHISPYSHGNRENPRAAANTQASVAQKRDWSTRGSFSKRWDDTRPHSCLHEERADQAGGWGRAR